MHNPVAKDWRELSKAASQESDPKKFMDLIEQLNEALEEKYGIEEEASDHPQPKTQLKAA